MTVPRWLTVVMRCDRAGSAWFVGAGFFFAPLLLILGPWPAAVVVAWVLISAAGLWLGVLGIGMAVGLAMVLRSGDEIPETYWWALLGERGDRDPPSTITR